MCVLTCCLWVWLVCWRGVAHSKADVLPSQPAGTPRCSILGYRIVSTPSLLELHTHTNLDLDCVTGKDPSFSSFSISSSFFVASYM